MLQDQINALTAREEAIASKIAELEIALKSAKNEASVIKKAKQSLEKLEEQLNGQTAVSE